MKHLIKHFYRFSSTEKTLLLSLILAFFFTFFSWFYQVNITSVLTAAGTYEETLTFSAYNGVTAVMGYFYAVFILLAIFLFVFSAKDKGLESCLNKKPWILLALTGQALFLLVLTFLVLGAYSMQFTRAGVESGLILTMLANLVAMFSAHFLFLQKKKVHLHQQFQSQMHSSVQLDSEEVVCGMDDALSEAGAQMSLADYQSIKTK